MPKLAKIILFSLSLILISCSDNENKSSDSNQKEQVSKKVRWKWQVLFLISTQLGTMGIRFQNQIAKVSGKYSNKIFEPGALVPALEVFDAVSSGSVDAGWSTPGYWAGKVSALPLFAAVPFGPSSSEHGLDILWRRKRVIRKNLCKYNIKGIFCGVIAPEASGWFRKEIKSIEDMKGMKMRFFGLRS